MSALDSGGVVSEARRGRPDGGFLGVLRVLALVALVAGAAGSVVFELRVGQRNDSRILRALFTVWVLSPFLAFALANAASRRWSVLARAALYGVIVVVTAGSLAIYGTIALGPPRPQPAFWFLVVPLASWVLLTIVVPLAALISRRRSRPGGEI